MPLRLLTSLAGAMAILWPPGPLRLLPGQAGSSERRRVALYGR